MDNYQSKLYQFQEKMISRIDEMEWLDIHNVGKPIDDVDTYLNYVPKWPLLVHMIAAALCLGMSAVYHLFFVYSASAYTTLAKLDYCGITILIFGSTIPSIQYLYACSPVFCKYIS
jgi:hypothetical protein